MAKRNNRVRSSVCGDPEEINQILDEEFNPVKTELEGMSAKELLESFAEYYYSNNRSVQPLGRHIDSFLEQFNPVKIENQEIEDERPKVKTTAAFDNSRLEFLRMTIGPVQNFYQTLGNVLYSLSMRVDSLHEEVIKQRVKQGLYEDYLKYTVEQNRVVTLDEFLDYLRIREEKVKRERDEAKTDKE